MASVSFSDPVTSTRWPCFISHPDYFPGPMATQSWWHWCWGLWLCLAFHGGLSGSRKLRLMFIGSLFCPLGDILWIGVIRMQPARLLDCWLSDPGKKCWLNLKLCLAHTLQSLVQVSWGLPFDLYDLLQYSPRVPPVYITQTARQSEGWVSSGCSFTPPYMCALLCACSFAYIRWFEPHGPDLRSR